MFGFLKNKFLDLIRSKDGSKEIKTRHKPANASFGSMETVKRNNDSLKQQPFSGEVLTQYGDKSKLQGRQSILAPQIAYISSNALNPSASMIKRSKQELRTKQYVLQQEFKRKQEDLLAPFPSQKPPDTLMPTLPTSTGGEDLGINSQSPITPGGKTLAMETHEILSSNDKHFENEIQKGILAKPANGSCIGHHAAMGTVVRSNDLFKQIQEDKERQIQLMKSELVSYRHEMDIKMFEHQRKLGIPYDFFNKDGATITDITNE